MAANIPKAHQQRLEWFERHLAVWQAAPGAVGLTVPQVNALAAAVAGARGAFDAATSARSASENATSNQTAKFRAMRAGAGDVLSYIKALADSQPNQSAQDAVFVAADLPLPTTRGTTPPPNAPRALTGKPSADGSITVRWKASENTGAIYIVYRRAGESEEGGWTQAGMTAKKWFIDTAALPAGTMLVQYQCRAIRGTQVSAMSATVSIPFGQMIAA